MPKEVFSPDYNFLEREKLLSFEEIARMSRIFALLRVEKIRLSRGEPLLRRQLERRIAMLTCIDGLGLTLTTNGSLLPEKARALKEAGLRRVTVSLDSLDDNVFRAMNDVDFPVQRVLAGIDAAAGVGLTPIKINMVVKRGVNERNILPMARYFRGTGHILRFIEHMDVGHSNGWRLDDVVPAKEILSVIHAEMPIELIDANYRGGVARRWRYHDGGGEIWIIASVTQPFRRDCSRARLSADGQLFTCLFTTTGCDLRSLLRGDVSDVEIADAIAGVWQDRSDRYSEIRSAATVKLPKVEMSYIGG